jgi:hypothetical protein
VAYGVFDRAASDAHAAEARWQELDARATRTRRRRDLRAADAARVRMFAARDAAVTARPTHRHCGGEVVLLRREAREFFGGERRGGGVDDVAGILPSPFEDGLSYGDGILHRAFS